MDERLKARLIKTCTRVYKDDGYTAAVLRLSDLYRENREGFEETLQEFRQHMEVMYGSKR